MRMKVKCTGYKMAERLFTVGKVYEWENGKMKNDNGFIYDNAMVGGTDIDKWLLSKWYSFEVVKDKKEFKVGDTVTIRQWDDMAQEFGVNYCGDIKCEACFVRCMKKYCGKKFKIISSNNNIYRLEKCDTWNFSAEMFEESKENHARKFKVGDIVKANKESNDRYGITNERNGFVGKVTKVYYDYIFVQGLKSKHRSILEDVWNVEERFFDLVQPKKQELHITVDGNRTIAVLKVDGNVVKRAEAKCNPSDTFDFKTGAELAFKRIFEEDKDD